MDFMHLHKTTQGKAGCHMKEVFQGVRDGLRIILDFAESNPLKAEKLELFTFTEKPMDVLDLLEDLNYAVLHWESQVE